MEKVAKKWPPGDESEIVFTAMEVNYTRGQTAKHRR